MFSFPPCNQHPIIATEIFYFFFFAKSLKLIVYFTPAAHLRLK